MDRSAEHQPRYRSSDQNNIVIVPTISFGNKHEFGNEPPSAIVHQTCMRLSHSEVNQPSMQIVTQRGSPHPTVKQHRVLIDQQPMANQINPPTLISQESLSLMEDAMSSQPMIHTSVAPSSSKLNEDVNQNFANVENRNKTNKVNTWASTYLQSIGHNIKPIKITLSSATNKLEQNNTTLLQSEAVKCVVPPTRLINTSRSNHDFDVAESPLEYSESEIKHNNAIFANINENETNEPVVVDIANEHVFSLTKKNISTQVGSNNKLIYSHNGEGPAYTTFDVKGNSEEIYIHNASKHQKNILDANKPKLNYEVDFEKKQPIMKLPSHKDMCEKFIKEISMKPPRSTKQKRDHSKSPLPEAREVIGYKKNYKSVSERKTDVGKVINLKKGLYTESSISKIETRPNHFKSSSPVKKDLSSRKNKKIPIKRETELEKLIKKKKVVKESRPLKPKPELKDHIKCKDIINKESSKIEKKITIVQERVKKSKSLTTEDKAQLKKQQLCQNQRKPSIDFKDFDNLSRQLLDSETKQNIVQNNSPVRQKLKRVHTSSEDVRNSPIKSVVKVAENSPYSKRQRLDESFDLRSKLSRVNQGIDNNIKTPIQNDTLTINKKLVQKQNIKVKIENQSDCKQKSPKQTGVLKYKTSKCKKLKLIINVVCQDSDDETTSDSSHSEDENSPTHTIDFSFLDDINVDEIVDSLKQHSPKHSIKKPVSPYGIKTEDTTKTCDKKLSHAKKTKNTMTPHRKKTKDNLDINHKINLSDILNKIPNGLPHSETNFANSKMIENTLKTQNLQIEDDNKAKLNWSQNSKLTTHALIKILSESNSLLNRENTGSCKDEKRHERNIETNKTNFDVRDEASFEDSDISVINESVIIPHQDSNIIDLTDVGDQESLCFTQENNCVKNNFVNTTQVLHSVLIDEQRNNFIDLTKDTKDLGLNNIGSENIFLTQLINVEDGLKTLDTKISSTKQDKFQQIKIKEDIATHPNQDKNLANGKLIENTLKTQNLQIEDDYKEKLNWSQNTKLTTRALIKILSESNSLLNKENTGFCTDEKLHESNIETKINNLSDNTNFGNEFSFEDTDISVTNENVSITNQDSSIVDLTSVGYQEPPSFVKVLGQEKFSDLNTSVNTTQVLQSVLIDEQVNNFIDLTIDAADFVLNDLGSENNILTQSINVEIELQSLNNIKSLTNEDECQQIQIKEETVKQSINVDVGLSKTLDIEESLIDRESILSNEKTKIKKDVMTNDNEEDNNVGNKQVEDLSLEENNTSINITSQSPKRPQDLVSMPNQRKLYAYGGFMNTLQLENDMKKYLHKDINIVNYIHQGNFSEILLCRDSSGCNYAAKIKKSSKIKLSKEKEKMLKHIQYDIPKQNLNIVYIIDGFVSERYLCYLLEYYPENLLQALKINKKPFHIDQVQILARQLLSAVMVLRTKEIVHSNIKPTHILLDATRKRLKLCGFDEAYYIRHENPAPNIGSYFYRAPEIILKLSAGFSIDVWSSALVIHQMATNTILFRSRFNNGVLYEQLNCLGNLPLYMVASSPFRSNYFHGTCFMKRFGPKTRDIVLFSTFFKTRLIYDSIWDACGDNWKAGSLTRLLEQMIVLDPRKRLSIEFVCADPFINDVQM